MNLWYTSNHYENQIEIEKFREVIVAAFFGVSTKSEKIRENFIRDDHRDEI